VRSSWVSTSLPASLFKTKTQLLPDAIWNPPTCSLRCTPWTWPCPLHAHQNCCPNGLNAFSSYRMGQRFLIFIRINSLKSDEIIGAQFVAGYRNGAIVNQWIRQKRGVRHPVHSRRFAMRGECLARFDTPSWIASYPCPLIACQVAFRQKHASFGRLILTKKTWDGM